MTGMSLPEVTLRMKKIKPRLKCILYPIHIEFT